MEISTSCKLLFLGDFYFEALEEVDVGGSLLFSVEDDEVSLDVIHSLLHLTVLEERQQIKNHSWHCLKKQNNEIRIYH